MACATRSIRGWAAWPWSEARDSRIRYNAPAPGGAGGNSHPSEDDKEGLSMSRSMVQLMAVIMLLVVGATGWATMEDNPKASTTRSPRTSPPPKPMTMGC
jgi:hypothetical protein